MKARQLEPGNVEAIVSDQWFAIKVGDYRGPMQALASLVKKNPDNFEAMAVYSLARFKSGELKAGSDGITEAYNREPTSLIVYSSLILADCDLMAFDKAKAILNIVIKKRQNDPSAFALD